jgi:hypothetical protein
MNPDKKPGAAHASVQSEPSMLSFTNHLGPCSNALNQDPHGGSVARSAGDAVLSVASASRARTSATSQATPTTLTQSAARKDDRSGGKVVRNFDDRLRGVTPPWRALYAFLTVMVIAAAMTVGCGTRTINSTVGQNDSTKTFASGQGGTPAVPATSTGIATPAPGPATTRNDTSTSSPAANNGQPSNTGTSSPAVHGGQPSNTGTSSPAADGGQPSNTGTPSNPAATDGSAGMVRLGCGQYCLQAGGYGGDGSTPNMTKILTTQVTALPDGTVAITVECLFRQPCLGALLLASGDSSTESACHTRAVAGSGLAWWGQSDLYVPAHTRWTLGVTLSPCALGLLSQRGILKVWVTADSRQTYLAQSSTDQKGLVPVEDKRITVSAP